MATKKAQAAEKINIEPRIADFVITNAGEGALALFRQKVRADGRYDDLVKGNLVLPLGGQLKDGRPRIEYSIQVTRGHLKETGRWADKPFVDGRLGVTFNLSDETEFDRGIHAAAKAMGTVQGQGDDSLGRMVLRQRNTSKIFRQEVEKAFLGLWKDAYTKFYKSWEGGQNVEAAEAAPEDNDLPELS